PPATSPAALSASTEPPPVEIVWNSPSHFYKPQRITIRGIMYPFNIAVSLLGSPAAMRDVAKAFSHDPGPWVFPLSSHVATGLMLAARRTLRAGALERAEFTEAAAKVYVFVERQSKPDTAPVASFHR